MTREDLLNKEVIKVRDIQEAYGVSYHTATGIIRAIKSFNDRLQIRGVVHVLDYIEYWEARSKFEKEKRAVKYNYNNHSSL